MAELLGIVTGVITVVETAGQVGSSILKLKQLWSEVKNVPQSVQALVDQLERINPLVDSMDAEFTELRHIVRHDKLAKASMAYCRQAKTDLEALIRDLQIEIESKRSLKRGLAKFRVVLKSGVIAKCQDRMQSSLQLLFMAQQTYLALTRIQPSLIAASICSTTRTHAEADDSARLKAANSTLEPAATKDTFKILSSRVEKRSPAGELTRPASLRHGGTWQRALLGDFVFETAEQVSDGWPQATTQVYRARVELPSWLSQKAWDFRLAVDLWQSKTCLRSYSVRPYLADIFRYIMEGDLAKVVEELASGRASIYDRNPDGWTLLHYAAIFSSQSSAIIKNLVQKGLDVYEVSDNGWAPWMYLYRLNSLFAKGLESDRLENLAAASEFLLSQYDTDDIKEIIRKVSNQPLCLCRGPAKSLIWTNPSLFRLIPEAYYEIPNSQRYRCITWGAVYPDLLMQVLQNDDSITPATFRAQIDDELGSARLCHLMRNYFLYHLQPEARLMRTIDFVENWRSMTRWVLTGIKLEEPWCSPAGSLPDALRSWDVLDDGPSLIYREIQFFLGKLNQTLIKWLEDMESAGVSLREYGRRELVAYQSSPLQRQRWIAQSRHGSNDVGPYLISFTYGKHPKDWKLHWDFMVEEFAGQFFEMVEEQRYRVPGAWVDE